MSDDKNKPSAAGAVIDDAADAAAALLVGMASLFMKPFTPIPEAPPPVRGAAAAAAGKAPAKNHDTTLGYGTANDTMKHVSGETFFDTKYVITSRPPSQIGHDDGFVSLRALPYTTGNGWSAMTRREVNLVIAALERARDRAYPNAIVTGS